MFIPLQLKFLRKVYILFCFLFVLFCLFISFLDFGQDCVSRLPGIIFKPFYDLENLKDVI